MAPEVLLGGAPDKAALSLPRLVDEVICGCPIDARRALYRNIVLCVRPAVGPGVSQRCSVVSTPQCA